jgi:hypothetical protein
LPTRWPFGSRQANVIRAIVRTAVAIPLTARHIRCNATLVVRATNGSRATTTLILATGELRASVIKILANASTAAANIRITVAVDAADLATVCIAGSGQADATVAAIPARATYAARRAVVDALTNTIHALSAAAVTGEMARGVGLNGLTHVVDAQVRRAIAVDGASLARGCEANAAGGVAGPGATVRTRVGRSLVWDGPVVSSNLAVCHAGARAVWLAGATSAVTPRFARQAGIDLTEQEATRRAAREAVAARTVRSAVGAEWTALTGVARANA